MTVFLAPALQFLSLVLMTLASFAVSRSFGVLDGLLMHLHNQRLAAVAERAVRAVEQTLARTQPNAALKAAAVALVRREFPFLPEDLLDTAIEAAVQGVKAGLPEAPPPVVIATPPAAANLN